VTNLTYTQAFILLGIPEEERDEFIVEHILPFAKRTYGIIKG
jgi:hypothetical protein